MRRALIVGCTGQDGSYLAEFLLSKGYDIHGTKRRGSSFNTERVDHLISNPQFHLHYADVTDPLSIVSVIVDTRPDEIYNLAAQSHVGVSFEQPCYTAEVVALGALNVFEAMRRYAPGARLYQASSSEMYGNEPAPQSERTPFAPVSPYACAKLFAHRSAITYRQSYGLHISCGILFNHESPRRGETFVTRKIARAVARIKRGKQKTLELGNLESLRDWGWAPDYVEAMWLMLQREIPDDYVIATGEQHSVTEFLSVACSAAGISESRVESGVMRLMRPSEVSSLRGDARRAQEGLGWYPRVGFNQIVRRMVEAEIAALS